MSTPSSRSREMGGREVKYPISTAGRCCDTVQSTWALALDMSGFESQLCCLLTLVLWRSYLTCLSISYKMSQVDMRIRENVDKVPGTQQVVTSIWYCHQSLNHQLLFISLPTVFGRVLWILPVYFPKCYSMVPEGSEQVNTFPNMSCTSRD